MTRNLSWVFAGIAYIGAPGWAYFTIAADREAQTAAYGFIKCGYTEGMVTLLACLVSGLFSLLAGGCALSALRPVPTPRPKIRTVEVILAFVPLPLAVIKVASDLWS